MSIFYKLYTIIQNFVLEFMLYFMIRFFLFRNYSNSKRLSIFTEVYDIALIDRQNIFVSKRVFHYLNVSFYATLLFLFPTMLKNVFKPF